jgi:iron(III) transport system substrate-binding protein
LAAPICAHAASVETVANYKGADRQQLLEAGAKQEGELTLYSSFVQGDAILKSFNEKYPYIQIHVFRGDGPILIQRVFEENAASHNIVDVIETASGGFQPLIAQGMLQSYISPELAAYPKEAIEKGGHYAFNYQSFVSLGFNTDLVPEAQAPKTLDDLLDPKWRDKMAFPATSTMADWIGAILLDKDEAYLRRLAGQRIRRYEISARALANLIVSGEVPMSPAVLRAHMIDSREHGAHVAWRALGGVYSNVSGLALPVTASHPNAAMLFIDFIFSRDMQVHYQTMGYSSARRDLENAESPSKIYYLTEQPGFMEQYEKWASLGQDIFGKSEPSQQ